MEEQVSPLGAAPPPVIVLRVTVRVPDLDSFITRYARHIVGDRIFIFSKTPQPVGTRVRFVLQLENGEALINGRGTVTRMQTDTSDARRPPGMELLFVPLDERSQTLIDFMLAARAGLTEEVPAIVRAVVEPKPALAKPALPAPKGRREPAKAGGRPTRALPLPAKSAASPSATPATTSALPALASPVIASPPQPSPPLAPSTVAAAPLAAAPLASVTPAPPVVSPSVVSPPVVSPPVVSPPVAPPASTPKPSLRPPSLSLDVGWSDDDAKKTADAPAPADPPATAATPPASAPVPALDATTLAQKLAEFGPLTLEAPTVDGPAPVVAETWRDPNAAATDLPANPFGEVSDGAIEYFVEWSIEQSRGTPQMPKARFSGVRMTLPGHTDAHEAYDPPAPKPLGWLGGVFLAGVLVGGGVVGLAMRRPAPAPAAAAPASGPTALGTPAGAVDEANEASAPSTVELAIESRPPGAAISVDGEPAGETPRTVNVTPGRHEIKVQRERYLAGSATAEAPGKIALELHRPPATLHVTSTPSAAEVTIAGVARGRTPVDVKLPGYESYDVRVALAGARPWRKSVYLSHAANRVDAALVLPKPPRPKK